MGEVTGISWCHHTFNTHWGCEKVSPACDSCYAEDTSGNYGFKIWGQDAPRRFFGDTHWNEPLKWNKKAASLGTHDRTFCISMGDIMENRRDLDPVRARLYDLIAKTQNLDWLMLTKRPELLAAFLPPDWIKNPPNNVWLMTTVESQDYLWRAHEIAAFHFPVRGLSVEPMLSPVVLDEGVLRSINWVICGTESGKKMRPTNNDHIRRLRDQCLENGIAFLVKQIMVDGKLTKDVNKFPKDLQIQQYPEVKREESKHQASLGSQQGLF